MGAKTNAKRKWEDGKLRGIKEEKKEQIYIAIKEEKSLQCAMDRKVTFLFFFGPSYTHHYC